MKYSTFNNEKEKKRKKTNYTSNPLKGMHVWEKIKSLYYLGDFFLLFLALKKAVWPRLNNKYEIPLGSLILRSH